MIGARQYSRMQALAEEIRLRVDKVPVPNSQRAKHQRFLPASGVEHCDLWRNLELESGQA